jgi:hypothetical protein
MDNYGKLLKALDDSGVYEKISEKLTESAMISFTVLKNKEATDDEKLISLISAVGAEVARQTVAMCLMMVFHPEKAPDNIKQYLIKND